MATRDYKLVRLWAQHMGSYEYHISEQVQRAKHTDAPADALFEIYMDGCPTGTWTRLVDLPDDHPFRKELNK